MAKRCGSKSKPCSYPRANWWKASMGVDWLGSGGGLPPENTVLPSIPGPVIVGVELTGSDGTWLNDPTSFTYLWKRDGVNISGATNNTYTPVSADESYEITFEVTAINSGGSTPATSAGVFPIEVVDFTGIDKVHEYGDSIMVSNNASPASNCYRARLAALYTWAETNHSLGGSGVWNEIKQCHQQSITRPSTVAIVAGALNDVRNSHDPKTFNKIESCLTSMLKRYFQKSGVAAGGASVTRVGSFTVFDAAVHGGKYDSVAGLGGNVACFNTTANATWTYTFTGTGICVTFSASDPTVNRGVAEVRIDNVLVDTVDDLMQRFDGVSDGVNDNKRGPHTTVYFGLTNASHTIEVKALTGSPSVVLDEFSVLDENIANLGVVFVLEVPKIVDYALPGRDQASDAYIDQVNDVRRAVVKTFKDRGYPAYFVNIMVDAGGLYDVTTGIDSDDIHPQNTGHDQIFDSITPHIDY